MLSSFAYSHADGKVGAKETHRCLNPQEK